MHRVDKLFIVFIIFYSLFIVNRVDAGYLAADEGAHGMTAVFYNKLISNFLEHPVTPSVLYDYVKAYYVRYPKFSFIYGPVYPVIGSMLFFFLPTSQFVLKLLTAFFGFIALLFSYKAFSNWFSKDVSLLAVVLLGTAPFIVSLSTSVLLEIPMLAFFMVSVYFFTKSFNSLKKRDFILSGVFMAVSIMTKEISLLFVFILFVIYLINYKKVSVKNISIVFVSMVIAALPYIALLYFSGGLESILRYPLRQAWYSVNDNDPQFYELSGWTYFFSVLITNFSPVFLVLLVLSFFMRDKSENGSRVQFFVLMSYVILSLLNDKSYTRMVSVAPFMCVLVSSFVYRFYEGRQRLPLLFFIVLAIVLQLPLSAPIYDVPMREVALDLFSSCPNCTVLVASEIGDVYSSYLMFESLLIDANASMRFLRPTVFSSLDAKSVIDSELVNRVVVIGTLDFINSNKETSLYASQVEYIMARYTLVKSYDSSFVGKIFVFDTGLTGLKEPPYCFTALAIGSEFCSDYRYPTDVFLNNNGL